MEILELNTKNATEMNATDARLKWTGMVKADRLIEKQRLSNTAVQITFLLSSEIDKKLNCLEQISSSANVWAETTQPFLELWKTVRFLASDFEETESMTKVTHG